MVPAAHWFFKPRNESRSCSWPKKRKSRAEQLRVRLTQSDLKSFFTLKWLDFEHSKALQFGIIAEATVRVVVLRYFCFDSYMYLNRPRHKPICYWKLNPNLGFVLIEHAGWRWWHQRLWGEGFTMEMLMEKRMSIWRHQLQMILMSLYWETMNLQIGIPRWQALLSEFIWPSFFLLITFLDVPAGLHTCRDLKWWPQNGTTPLDFLVLSVDCTVGTMVRYTSLLLSINLSILPRNLINKLKWWLMRFVLLIYSISCIKFSVTYLVTYYLLNDTRN